MTTIGAQAMQDVHESALKVIAAFKDDPVLPKLNDVQRACLEDLSNACRFLYDLTARRTT